MSRSNGFEVRQDSAGRRWAVILAGGDGKRLLPLTRRIAGDDRPKQFCRVLGEETLLHQTRSRVARLASPDRTFSVVTKAHEEFYREHTTGPEAANLLVQPCNRGTGPAIVYSLARLHALEPKAVVGFFPSDHHFSDGAAFSGCVAQAFASAEHSDSVILLGITPDQAETGYGWIEPAEPLRAAGPGLIFAVRRFWEKPSQSVAVELMRRGCVWNSFIMVGRVESFLGLVEEADPRLFQSFQSMAAACLTGEEEARVFDLYANLPSRGFSENVLSVCPSRLAVLCSRTLAWTDVGDVERALSLMARERALMPPRSGGAAQPETIRTAAAVG